MKFFIAAGFLLTATGFVRAQSADQLFPTPLRTSEIVGTVPARAIGDSRLTQYYYTFEGGQGDIFINVVTSNFTGDIDVYVADSLQPLTKIVLYADRGTNETGRVVYLRQPARILLRVQGRTPNDDPATYQIKFAGSFIASSLPEAGSAPVVDPSSRARRDDSERVIEPTAEKSEAKDIERPEIREVTPGEKDIRTGSQAAEKRDTEKVDERSDTPPRVVITPAPAVRTVIGGRPSRSRSPEEKAGTATDRSRRTPSPEARRSTPPPPAAPDPLASIRLVIVTKAGETIEHPMSEVVRFSVDKGMLTLVVKDGKTNRHSILNIQRVTIE